MVIDQPNYKPGRLDKEEEARQQELAKDRIIIFRDGLRITIEKDPIPEQMNERVNAIETNMGTVYLK